MASHWLTPAMCSAGWGHGSCQQHTEHASACCLQKLRVVDVTTGTSVSLADGFQISSLPGVWNVPAGALLYAPHVAVPSMLSLTTFDNTSAFG